MLLYNILKNGVGLKTVLAPDSEGNLALRDLGA